MALTLTRIRQQFPRPRVGDVGSAVAAGFGALGLSLRPGASIAVAVGSRGIADLAVIVKATIDALKRAGAHPFIVPAMGSHGGATAEGQTAVLDGYGVSERTMGVPVRSSMETVELARGNLPNRVYMDRLACEADGILLVNRIKPHTDFQGRYESGLAKMAVVGLGKHAQALEMHRFGVLGLRDLIPRTASVVLAGGKVLAGVAVVENAHDEVAAIEVLAAAGIMEREPALLERARQWMPSLLVDDIDVLVVDRLGKDVSGTGMDPSIIGRMRIRGEPEPLRPRIRAILVDDLTEVSHGNALGVGLADVITEQLRGKIDFAPMYENAVTSTFLERAKVPVVVATAREGLAIALSSCGALEPGRERIVRIQDTLHLSDVLVSAALRDELRGREGIEVTEETVDLFDRHGMLSAAWPASSRRGGNTCNG